MCRPQDMYVEHSLHFALKFPVVSLGTCMSIVDRNIKPFHCPQTGIKTHLHKISSLLPTLRINRSEFNFRSELFLTEFIAYQ
jgi:ABC-type ATPase with predicted acetyltransferase domain